MSYNENRRSAPVMVGSSTNDLEHVLLQSEFDQLFQILGSRQRRLILMSIKDGPVKTTTELMHRGGRDAGTNELKLVHIHLPKLEDAGYIEWDRARGEISQGANFEEIKPVLELLETHADELRID